MGEKSEVDRTAPPAEGLYLCEVDSPGGPGPRVLHWDRMRGWSNPPGYTERFYTVLHWSDMAGPLTAASLSEPVRGGWDQLLSYCVELIRGFNTWTDGERITALHDLQDLTLHLSRLESGERVEKTMMALREGLDRPGRMEVRPCRP